MLLKVAGYRTDVHADCYVAVLRQCRQAPSVTFRVAAQLKCDCAGVGYQLQCVGLCSASVANCGLFLSEKASLIWPTPECQRFGTTHVAALGMSAGAVVVPAVPVVFLCCVSAVALGRVSSG